MTAVGVVIVHHEEASRHEARAVVTATPAFDAVGEATSAEEALELAVTLRPALALVGTEMPGIDGFEASQRLRAAVPGAIVVLLYSGAQPEAPAVDEAGAAAALHVDELTPASLQAFGKGFQSE